MKKLLGLILAYSFVPALCFAQEMSDSERLDLAIDYFQSKKYHEAMLILQPLNKKYQLNPRFKAYLGVCYYYEWEYRKATEMIDSLLPKLSVFAPQEQSVYCLVSAESHFNLNEYEEALKRYEQMLNLCHDNEKGDAYYRMGFCYMQLNNEDIAEECWDSALNYYEAFPNDKNKARIAQLKRMTAALKAKRND